MAVLEKVKDTSKLHNIVDKSTEFKIRANAKSFKILSDGIYPNKILAVVRELSTNANDATIDASKVKELHYHLKNGTLPDYDNEWIQEQIDIQNKHPFYDLSNHKYQLPIVHLPNKEEQWFSIRDFGTGLSPEFAQTLYTEYFFSNKTNSNDYTGCLGLGSKSPFCYTDSFTVTSYWNGTFHTYLCYIQGGFPKINPVNSGPTNEANGVLITVNIKNEQDIAKFSEVAKQVYSNFNVLPKIIGNSKVSQYLEELHKNRSKNPLNCNEFYKYEDESYCNYALMGNIAYPIEKQYDKSGFTGFVIRFNLGELDIVPSREALSYDENTIKNISTKLENIKNVVIPNKINEYLGKESNKFEANKKYLEIKSYFGDYFKVDSLNFSASFELPTDNSIICNLFSKDGKKYESCKLFRMYSKFEMYEVDMPVGSFSRCQLKSNTDSIKVYCLDFKGNDAVRDSFKELVGLPKDFVFNKTSSLPKPDRVYTKIYEKAEKNESFIFKYKEPTGRGYNYHYRRNNNSQYREYSYWDDVTTSIDLSKGGVYVEMRANKMYINGIYSHPKDIMEYFQILKSIDNDFTLIGVRKTLIKEFQKSDDWVSLSEYITKIFEQKKDIKDNVELYRNLTKDKKIYEKNKFFIRNFTYYFPTKVVNDLENCLKYKNYSTLASYINYKEAPSNYFDKEVAKLVEKNKFLEIIFKLNEQMNHQVGSVKMSEDEINKLKEVIKC